MINVSVCMYLTQYHMESALYRVYTKPTHKYRTPELSMNYIGVIMRRNSFAFWTFSVNLIVERMKCDLFGSSSSYCYFIL